MLKNIIGWTNKTSVSIDSFEGKRGVNWTIHRVNLIFWRFNNRRVAQSTVELNDSFNEFGISLREIDHQSIRAILSWHTRIVLYTIDLLCHPIIHLAHTHCSNCSLIPLIHVGRFSASLQIHALMINKSLER